MTMNGSAPAPIELPETGHHHDDFHACKVVECFWRFRRDRSRYRKGYALAEAEPEGTPRKAKLDSYAEHVLSPAAIAAETDLIEAIVKFRRPRSESLDAREGASVVRVGNHLLVVTATMDDDGNFEHYDNLLVVPLAATARARATKHGFFIPERHRNRPVSGPFPIHRTFALDAPGLGQLDLAVWAGSDADYEACGPRGQGWAAYPGKGFTIAVEGKILGPRTPILSAEPDGQVELDPAPEPAATDPAA